MSVKAVHELQKTIHARSKENGNWPELQGFAREDKNDFSESVEKIDVGKRIEEIEISLSLATANHNRGRDEKHPQFTMFNMDLADAVMGILDLCEATGGSIAGAIATKLKFDK
jgi:hypothetical protein